jgi:hypothetical protein
VLDGAHRRSPVPGKKQGVEGVITRHSASSCRCCQLGSLRAAVAGDEADRFFEQDGRNDFEDTRRLKQLMDETGRRFKVVFAGLHNVLRMTERPEPSAGALRRADRDRAAARG